MEVRSHCAKRRTTEAARKRVYTTASERGETSPSTISGSSGDLNRKSTVVPSADSMANATSVPSSQRALRISAPSALTPILTQRKEENAEVAEKTARQDTPIYCCDYSLAGRATVFLDTGAESFSTMLESRASRAEDPDSRKYSRRPDGSSSENHGASRRIGPAAAPHHDCSHSTP